MNKRFLAFFLILSVLFSIFSLGNFESNSMAASKRLRINVNNINMTVGQTFKLRVYNMKKNYTAKYKASNPDLVRIEKNGKKGKLAKITALAVGKVTIKVTIKKKNKKKKTIKCRIKIGPTAVSIKFMKRYYHVQLGEQLKLDLLLKPNTSIEQPVFESADKSILTISGQGVVTPVSPGVTTVTATLLSSGQKSVCTILVEEA